MNLVEKIHALMVHPDIRIWHYHFAKEKSFEYAFAGESHRFDTMEQMIEAAYVNIDPLKKALPASIEKTSTERPKDGIFCT